jgi:hypothetical protein
MHISFRVETWRYTDWQKAQVLPSGVQEVWTQLKVSDDSWMCIPRDDDDDDFLDNSVQNHCVRRGRADDAANNIYCCNCLPLCITSPVPKFFIPFYILWSVGFFLCERRTMLTREREKKKHKMLKVKSREITSLVSVSEIKKSLKRGEFVRYWGRRM